MKSSTGFKIMFGVKSLYFKIALSFQENILANIITCSTDNTQTCGSICI